MNRVFAVAASLVLVLACASGQNKKSDAKDTTDATAPRYSAEPGPIAVGVIPSGSLHDAKRNKDMEVWIDYPTKGGPSPIVIFSHGLGSSPRDFTSLASYWASKGFVVIRPAHSDARRQRDAQPEAEQLEKQGPADWRNRAQDISFIIDSLGALEQQYPELQGKMNHDQIAVAGYSFGAFTTMLVGGVRTFAQGQPAVYRDPRVKAILSLSPQGPGEGRGLTRESWSDVKLPAMYVTGSADMGSKEGENADWRSQAFELSPAGDKWLVVVQGAGHMTLAGRSSASGDPQQRPPTVVPSNDPRYPGTTVQPVDQTPPSEGRVRGSAGFERDRNLFRAIQAISLAFFDTYLKNESAGREYLNKLTSRSDLQVKTK